MSAKHSTDTSRRKRPIFLRRWHDYWVWNFHRCDVCAWRFNLGKIGIGRYRHGAGASSNGKKA